MRPRHLRSDRFAPWLMWNGDPARATLLDEAGVPMKRIQALLGHKDIRVTQNYIKTAKNTRKSASHELQL